MFKHEDNEKIGKYLSKLIEQNYGSQRAFGRTYLKLRDKREPSEDEVTNMANRLSQIIKGNKAVQTYDLPYFSKLLGVSCEQILSAGACCVPTGLRLTNHSIACSKNPEEWEAYVNHPDKPILNCDEYCKTVLDYAIEFGNYEFIQYLIDNDYIWFDDGSDTPSFRYFRAGTSIEPRKQYEVDYGMIRTLNENVALRRNLIVLAIKQNDIKTLKYFHAEADRELYASVTGSGFGARYPYDFEMFYGLDMLQHIADSNEDVLDFFTEPFIIETHACRRVWTHSFFFPPISRLLDLLIAKKSNFAETALKKALKHNKETYDQLLHLFRLVKDEEFYKREHNKDLWKNQCKRNISFDENCNMISFHTINICFKPNDMEGIITNVVHISELPASPVLKHLAEEINKMYDKIRNIGEHLEEV